MLRTLLSVVALSVVGATACTTPETQAEEEGTIALAGQSAVRDDESQPDIVKVAVGSADHSTLVAALKAAGLVDAMSNAGPFTVFAPTNAAFDALPAGTVDNLLKPENKSALVEVLQHHVTTSALDLDMLEDGQELGMVSGGPEVISRKDGEVFIGSARVIASVRASNGWVHVIDKVLAK